MGMEKLDALKEALREELFTREPLAASIALYLNRKDPGAYREILDTFDEFVDIRLEHRIKEAIENDEAGKVR